MWGRMGVWLGMGARRSRDSTGQETCQPFIHTTRYTRSTLSLGTLNVDGAGAGGLRGHANNRGSRQAGRQGHGLGLETPPYVPQSTLQ